MKDVFETIRVEAHQRVMTHMVLGQVSGELPRHLMQGTKETGYIVNKDTVTEWYWDNVIDRGGKRYLIFRELEVVPFSRLFTTDRTDMVKILRNLAFAMTKLPTDFIQSHNGFIELWRIFVITHESFLFLPKTLSDIILFTADDEIRYEMYGQFVKAQTEVPFALCHQFTQLLYTACTLKTPYHDRDVREDRWNHMPLSILQCKIDGQLARWIDQNLVIGYRTQREVTSAASSSAQNLSWWLRETAQFDHITITETRSFEEMVGQSSEARSFLTQQHRRASQRVFWRKKGALIISVTLASAIVLSIIGNYVVQQLKPPYTAGMDGPMIISEFFDSLNALDATRMEASFARRVKNPFEHEVTSLFVNSKVRMAYEGKDTIITADQWVENGKPSIPSYAMIYGVADVRIVQTKENSYRALFRYFIPDEDPDAPADETFGASGNKKAPGYWVSESEMVMDFVLTDQKDYWQIQDIQVVSSVPVGTYMIETHEVETTMSPMMF